MFHLSLIVLSNRFILHFCFAFSVSFYCLYERFMAMSKNPFSNCVHLPQIICHCSSVSRLGGSWTARASMRSKQRITMTVRPPYCHCTHLCRFSLHLGNLLRNNPRSIFGTDCSLFVPSSAVVSPRAGATARLRHNQVDTPTAPSAGSQRLLYAYKLL
jgi:hypothetical protein